jgi:hypothetical protein
MYAFKSTFDRRRMGKGGKRDKEQGRGRGRGRDGPGLGSLSHTIAFEVHAFLDLCAEQST